MTAKAPDVSIIIPAYNSEKTISRCLQSIFLQDTKLRYEVIVADSSLDRTTEIIRRDFPSVKLIHSTARMYIGQARNAGLKKARAKIIIFIDSDCVVSDKKWMEKIFTAHEKHDIIGTRIQNGNPWNIFGWVLFFIEFIEFVQRKNRKASILLGYNVSYKRKILDKYGPFAGHHYVNEDLLYNSRITEPLFFISSTFVSHINKTNPVTIFDYCFTIGLGSGLARKQQPQLEGHFLFKYPFLIPLLFFYRYARMGYRAISTRYFPVFILVTPLLLFYLIPYIAGFFSAAFKNSNKL